MDERLEKALQTTNFMASLNLSKKTVFEEFKQGLIFYQNGCSFTADLDTISKVNALSQLASSGILLDNNNTPVEISNLKEFLSKCLSIYQEQSESYKVKFDNIRKQRNIKSLMDL